MLRPCRSRRSCKRAQDYAQRGANVIDLGCLPDTPFPHLEQAIAALKDKGYQVSVDSADPDELLRGGKAGADFLLSLNEDTLRVADEVDSIPVLIPKDHGDLASLYRAMDRARRQGAEISGRSGARPHQFRLHGVARALRPGAGASGPMPRC